MIESAVRFEIVLKGYPFMYNRVELRPEDGCIFLNTNLKGGAIVKEER